MISGAALLSAMLLLPAQDRLAESEHQRDRAEALSKHASKRLASHASYLDALDRGDETLLRSLAASELNLIPRDHRVLRTGLGSDDPMTLPPVLDRLEPDFVAPTRAPRPDTRLRRLASDPTARLWIMAVGMIAVLYGLLPPITAKPRV